MSAGRHHLAIERTLLVLLTALWLTPLTLTVLVRTLAVTPPWANWLKHPWVENSSLFGVQITTPAVPLSMANAGSGRFQESVGSQFNRHFAGREALIRTTNEFWFRLFHESANRASTLVIGPNDWVYDEVYLREYYLSRPSKADLEPMVRDLRRLQDACRALGIAFVVVSTPSKAATYPEENPRAWRSRYDERPRGHALMGELLASHGVVYVDGATLTRQEKARNPGVAPLFPKGGIHWNQVASLPAANAILARFRMQGLNLAPLEASDPIYTDSPPLADQDVVMLLNLAVPWRFPCAITTVLPTEVTTGRPPNAVLVGGSFTELLAKSMSASGQFSEIDVLYYCKAAKFAWINGESHRVREPVGEIDYAREVFAADCLVLEFNEQAVAVSPRHLAIFLEEALAFVEKGLSTRKAFAYETRTEVRWGEPLSFAADSPNGIRPASLNGFSPLEPHGAWTMGREAGVRLVLPDPACGAILQARVSAFLEPRLLPERRASVFANNELVAEWKFSSGQADDLRQATIPARLCGESGVVQLRFVMDSVTSPQALGLSVDARELGINLSELRVWKAPPGATKVPDDFLQTVTICDWDKEIDFGSMGANGVNPASLKGFSTPEADATWTEQSSASVRLLAPAAGVGLRLSLDAVAFLHPEQMPRRQVRVFVNDRELGLCDFSSDDVPEREILIPPSANEEGGLLVVRFEIMGRAISPASLGMSPDQRNLGIKIAKISLRPSTHPDL